METQEDRVPLLPETESGVVDSDLDVVVKKYPLRTPPRDVVVSLQSSDGVADSSSNPQPLADGKKKRKKHYSGNEMIVAVFVTAFDTKRGNVIEWRYPDVVNLDGVEFKSMASGLHNVPKDFIYFKHNQLFGLSCYEKIPVATEGERGARMRSVGLVAVGYSDLHLHKDFLQRQARSQVETPGDYGSLEEYFRHYQAPHRPPLDALATSDLPSMSITHPAGCFTQFMQFFGANIFVLWKLALLKKKILLFSPPPIGVVCYRVYCTCLLASHSLDLDLDTDSNPQFYVNVADIDSLKAMDSYVACTTERIFESKPELYNVFVDNQNISTHSPSLELLLKPTLADRYRFEHLSNVRTTNLMAVGPNEQCRDEIQFARFFQNLNSDLFQVLLEASNSEDHVLTMEMITRVGLHPVNDRHFLTELAFLHNLNVNVQRRTDPFSCCI